MTTVPDNDPPIAIPRNALPANCWSAIPDEAGTRMLAMQYQLEQTQWWPAARLYAEHSRQLMVLLAHARDTVPFYHQRLAHLDLSRGLDVAAFASAPLLTCHDVQNNFEPLQSTRVPAEHRRLRDGDTSGSTGQPVRFRTTELCGLFCKYLRCAITCSTGAI